MRKRMLNPDFFTDPDIVASLDAYGRLLYQGLWCVADDSGCFELNSLLLKMKILPGDQNITTEDIQKYLDILIEQKKIITYEVNDKKYSWIKNFHKHQTLNKPNSPTVPLPSWITFHGEEEYGTERHKYYYEIDNEILNKYLGKTEDRQDIDNGKTEDRLGKEMSTPEEKRKEEKRKEVNNKKRSDSESSPNPSSDNSDQHDEENQEEHKFNKNSKPYKAACYLRKKILENNKRAQVPNKDPASMEDWSVEMDRLNRLGPIGAKESENKNYSWEEIIQIIDWCQDHHFWKNNILSVAKLRKQIIELENQMNSDSKVRKFPNKSNGPPTMEELISKGYR